MKRLFFLLVLSSFWVFSVLPAGPEEDYYLRSFHITAEDGLSDDSVTCIMQDKTGFIWIGTIYGLNRYDGYNFKMYKYLSSSSLKDHSLSDNWVKSIMQDSGGYIWIGMEYGLDRLDPETDLIKHYKTNPDNTSGILGNEVVAMHEDKYGNLWFGTNSGLHKYQRETDNFRHYPMQVVRNPKTSKQVGSSPCEFIHEDRVGRLWIGNDKNIYSFDRDTELFLSLGEIYSPLQRYETFKFRRLCQDRNGNYWISTPGKGLLKYTPVKKSVTLYNYSALDAGSISDDFIRTIYESPSGELWLGTSTGGLNRYDEKNDRFIRYMFEANRGRAASNNMDSILEDRYGVLWTGIYGKGITKIVRTKKIFTSYVKELNNRETLPGSSVLAIYEDHLGVLWVGTDSGLSRYDTEKNRFVNYTHDPSNPDSISDNTVRSIAEDKFDRLWIATHAGLNRFDRKTGVFIRYLNDEANPRSLSVNAVKKLYTDRSGTLWIGTWKGLNRYNYDSDDFTRFVSEPGNPHSLSHGNVFTIHEDREGILWVGTREAGLNRFDKKRSRFTHYMTDPKNPRSLSSPYVTSIHEDNGGRLWVGTKDGLNLMDRKTGTFTRYYEKDGLPNSIIYGILEDTGGNLWISTNRGLCKFSPYRGVLKNYFAADGLQSNEFNGDVCFQNKNGKMYFGGILGFTTFYPNRIKEDYIVPPVVLVSVEFFGERERKIYPPLNLKSIKLPYKEKLFSMEFAVLDFRAPRNNRYAFFLEGLDSGWNFTGSRNFATYTNLEPGKYRLHVKGADSSAIWNKESLSLDIRIIPPVWKTAWFRLLAFLLLASVVFFLVRWRMKEIKNREKRLQDLVEHQTRELKERKEQLEKINNIVKTINSELDFRALLESVLKQTFVFKEVDKAYALVYVKAVDAYEFKASLGMDIKRFKDIRLTPGEAEERYCKGTKELFNDAFLVEDVKGRTGEKKVRPLGIPKSMLVLRIRVRNEIPGYLVFDNMKKDSVFDKQSIEMLKNLKDHIVSAFVKIKLMLDLHKEREVAVDANRSKGEFLARMSHEIRTPMNSVIGFAEMLLDTELNTEQKDFTRAINQSGEVLLTLINEILDFSRIEAGELVLDEVDFDPEDTAFGVCELILPRIADKPVEILCRARDNVPPYIKGDPGRFRQVLINLVGNAVKFTEEGVIEVTLEVKEEKGDRLKLQVDVRDTGIGIPGDKLDTVFEVFQQADGSVTRKYGGSGLGLSISRQIARLMNGDLSVDSTHGQGSVFHFTAWMTRSPDTPGDYSIPENLPGRNILVVDDNKNNLEILAHVLGKAGLRVTVTDAAENAIPLLTEGLEQGDSFDLCIIDIRMPDINGYDLARDIRGHPSPISDIPLMAYSSSVVNQMKMCADAGFDVFLPKPARRPKLLDTLSQLLEERKSSDVPVNQVNMNMGEETLILESAAELSGEQDTVHGFIPAFQSMSESDTESGVEAEAQPSGPQILLVEDNPINRRLAGFMLTRAGFLFDTAENGREAVEKFAAQPHIYDLILMDIQMPEMDGYQATQKIRKIEAGLELHLHHAASVIHHTSHIPIIAMTAQTMEGDREACILAGMDDYISKPIKREKIVEMVKKWLSLPDSKS